MPKTEEQVRRAYRVLDHIESNPDRHNQGTWLHSWYSLSPELPVGFSDVMEGDCGTTACFAGWTALLAGDKFVWDATVLPAGKGYYQAVANRARKLLGLTLDEETRLFYDAQDLADVRKAVFEIFGPRPDGAI